MRQAPGLFLPRLQAIKVASGTGITLHMFNSSDCLMEDITTPANKRTQWGVISPWAESRNEPPKLGTRFGRGLVVAQARWGWLVPV